MEIKPGSYYTKEEIESKFDHGFGFQIRGINRVTDEKGTLKSMIVFSKHDGPYEDTVGESRLTYWGEIQKGSHETAYNKGLVRSMIEDIPVHFFHKEESSEKWKYLGDVDVVGVEETKDKKDRTNYKFDIEISDSR